MSAVDAIPDSTSVTSSRRENNVTTHHYELSFKHEEAQR